MGSRFLTQVTWDLGTTPSSSSATLVPRRGLKQRRGVTGRVEAYVPSKCQSHKWTQTHTWILFGVERRFFVFSVLFVFWGV